jgi:hypothetical protein
LNYPEACENQAKEWEKQKSTFNPFRDPELKKLDFSFLPVPQDDVSKCETIEAMSSPEQQEEFDERESFAVPVHFRSFNPAFQYSSNQTINRETSSCGPWTLSWPGTDQQNLFFTTSG